MELEHQFDQDAKLIPSTHKNVLEEDPDGSFECYICLDSANDPVVSPCGHLYCWSCIYKWLYIQSAALPHDEYPRCPVCKGEISHTTLIPLYGRGQFTGARDDKPKSTPTFDGMVIPPRPSACGARALLNAASQPEHRLFPFRRNPYQSHTRSLYNQASNAIANVFQPVMSRQEMQVDKSLSRISLFLLCCFLFCLFLV